MRRHRNRTRHAHPHIVFLDLDLGKPSLVQQFGEASDEILTG